MKQWIWLPFSAALALAGSGAWAQSAPNPFPQTRPTFIQQPFMFSSGAGFANQSGLFYTPGVGVLQQRPAFTQTRPTFIQQPFMFSSGVPFANPSGQFYTPGAGLLQQRPAFTQAPYTFSSGTAFRK